MEEGRHPAADLLERARAGPLAGAGDMLAQLESAGKAFAGRGDAASALELAALTWRAWLEAGELSRGRAVMSSALAIAASPPVDPWRCRVLYADGVLAFRMGDDAGSLARNEEALRMARESGDPRGECETLTGLARLALRAGDYARVASLATKGREIARASGDASLETGPLHLHAAAVRLMGDYGRARSLYEESRALALALQRPAIVAMEEHNLGWVCVHQGDARAAAAHFERAHASPSPNAYARAWRSLNDAAVALCNGERSRAIEHYRQGTSILAEQSSTLDPDDRLELEWLRSQLE
jgi:tetratricopeptide (TPR) repeat protein